MEHKSSHLLSNFVMTRLTIPLSQITLAEMGFFRTNFVKNHTYSVYDHPAYTNPQLLGNITRSMLTKVDPSIIKGIPISSPNVFTSLRILLIRR
jgi:hypothetical protein